MNVTAKTGVLTISLDFELHWGVRDKRSLESYKANLLGERSVVPMLLDLFEEFQIHATWATVGILFFETRDELLAGLPREKPSYRNPLLNPYLALDQIGRTEADDPYHFAPSVIELIATRPFQEIGTHTFSHYYCLEQGQTPETFKQDLRAALRVAKQKYGRDIESIVFPRNQYNRQYVEVCRESGIRSYRGNPPSWLYAARNRGDERLGRRALRLLDNYVNLTGHNTYEAPRRSPCNVGASRFLRPYSAWLRWLEPLRRKRIRDDLTHAASHEQVYHLWWHPHNFGVSVHHNLAFLRKILEHFRKLRLEHGMRSLNMGELARLCEQPDA